MKYKIGDRVFIKVKRHDHPIPTYYTGTGIIKDIRNNVFAVQLTDWTRQTILCRSNEIEKI